MALTHQQTQRYKETLEAERDRVHATIATIDKDLVISGISDPEGDTFSDVSAAAVAIETHDRAAQIADHERHMLGEIEAALQRIDTGAYGACQQCGKPIPIERLEALPWAGQCIGCIELRGAS